MVSKIIFTFLFAVAGCHANSLATGASTQRIMCGQPSAEIFWCLGHPNFLPREMFRNCKNQQTQCDAMKCVSAEAGWMDNNKVNKSKIAEHFDQFASQHPEWTPSVNHLKAACLGDTDVPPQGVALKCAPYDIIYCAQISFIKYAAPSQWKTTPECESVRAFAAACPICPSDCFAPQIPIGSCNACSTLPRSA